MSNPFVPLDDDEVVYISNGRILLDNPTFKVGELLDALAQLVSDREADWSEDHEAWFSEGSDCEVLRLSGSGWQRGRIRPAGGVFARLAPRKDCPIGLRRRMAVGNGCGCRPGRWRMMSLRGNRAVIHDD
ncbi:MAG: KGK domain-containing protein [Alkalinema sp. RL_2_19]|nr:KGK domain-containing protein [Alkalinema sp. RL_2_19]